MRSCADHAHLAPGSAKTTSVSPGLVSVPLSVSGLPTETRTGADAPLVPAPDLLGKSQKAVFWLTVTGGTGWITSQCSTMRPRSTRNKSNTIVWAPASVASECVSTKLPSAMRL